MKKYVNRKCYDTDTAHKVGTYKGCWGHSGIAVREETLYRKRTGEYFLYVWDRLLDEADTETIAPVSCEKARAWAEERLDADAIEAEWGEPAEDDRESVNVWVCPEAKAALTAECRRTGDTQANVVERLLLGLV